MEISKMQSLNTVMEVSKIQSLDAGTKQSMVSKNTNLEQKVNKVQNDENFTEEDSNKQQDRLLHAIEKASGKFESQNNQLSFAVHEKTKQIMVKVINKDTQEVVREIPSKKILDMVADRMEAAGLLIDEKR